MIDLEEGVREIFLDAQAPVFEAVRLAFTNRVQWRTEHMLSRTATYRARHPGRRKASDNAYNAARKESRRAYDRARHAARRKP